MSYSGHRPRAFRGDHCYSNRQGWCERCNEPTGSAALAYCARCLRVRARERAEREAMEARRLAARPPVPSLPEPPDGLPF